MYCILGDWCVYNIDWKCNHAWLEKRKCNHACTKFSLYIPPPQVDSPSNQLSSIQSSFLLYQSKITKTVLPFSLLLKKQKQVSLPTTTVTHFYIKLCQVMETKRVMMSSERSKQKKRSICRRLGKYMKEQKGRIYIIRRCVVMLLCWHDWWSKIKVFLTVPGSNVCMHVPRVEYVCMWLLNEGRVVLEVGWKPVCLV